MRLVLRLLLPFALLVSAQLAAQEAVRVPPEVLATIVDDETHPLPRSMTPAERLLPLPRPDLRSPLAPPTGTVRTPAEYERNDGLLIRWGAHNDLLTALTVGITTGDTGAVVHILVASSSQQSSAAATLTAAGAVMERVNFILYAANSVWIRDYGPRFIWQDDGRAIVDHTYNRDRPLDNAFPDHLAGLWGEPQYDIPLTHGGGNFHLFAHGDAYMTDLVLAENPALSAADVAQLFQSYQGLDLSITAALPSWYDSTQHIDMWLLPTADDAVILGQYSPSDSAAHALTEAIATDLQSHCYTVRRTPGWQSGGTHYTYTNSVIFNDLVFVCQFNNRPIENAAALATFEASFPGSDIIPVNCSSIIAAAGALHCIVMHVPAGPAVFRDGFESGDTGAWAEAVGAS